MGDVLTSPRFLLMRLAGATTIDPYLLEEDDVLMEMIEHRRDFQTLLNYCNENY